MVVTKVIQIKSARQLGTGLDYITDEAKTVEYDSELALRNAMTYIENPDKTSLSLEAEGQLGFSNGKLTKHLVYGYGVVDPSSATEEFLLTTKMAESLTKTTGRKKEVLAHHIIQSFSPEDNLTPEEVMEIGRRTVMELTGGEHEFVIATHLDKGHLHNHIIFNATNQLTHKQFRWQKNTSQKLFLISNRHADLAGAKVLDNKPERGYQDYKAYRRKNNYRFEIKERLNLLMKMSHSLDDFKEKAKMLSLEVDFSRKEARYRLRDSKQERYVRDKTLSKKGYYSLDSITQKLSEQSTVFTKEEVKTAFDQLQKDKANDFEMKLTVEPWQVENDTRTGIYLKMDYGLANQGIIKIANRYIERLDDGTYELYLKKSDFFYFINPDYSENNRFMKGETLIKQLAKDSGEVVIKRNRYISSLNRLVKEFEFLSEKGITEGKAFEELSHQFRRDFKVTEDLVGKLDEKLTQLNKVASALSGLHDNPYQKQVALEILASYKLSPDTPIKTIEKEILELSVERQALRNKLDSVAKDFNFYQEVKENVEARKESRVLY